MQLINVKLVWVPVLRRLTHGKVLGSVLKEKKTRTDGEADTVMIHCPPLLSSTVCMHALSIAACVCVCVLVPSQLKSSNFISSCNLKYPTMSRFNFITSKLSSVLVRHGCKGK